MHLTVRMLLAAGLALALGPALAADVGEQVKARQARFKALGADFKALNDGLRGGGISPGVQASAQRIGRAAAALPGWFPARTADDVPGSRAKAAIWSAAADFAAVTRSFRAETIKLEALLRSGDAAGAATQARAVGQACAACHARFRTRE